MWREGPFSLAYLTVDGATATEHVQAAAAAGFSYAGVRIAPPPHLPQQDALLHDRDQVRDVLALSEQLGVKLLDAEVMCLAQATTRTEMETLVATADELGFTYLQTVIDNSDLNHAARQVAELAAIASQHSLAVALEFMPFRPLSRLSEALLLIDKCGANNVQLVLDALHFFRSGSHVTELRHLNTDVALVQLCDAPRIPPPELDLISEAREQRLEPGRGELALHALLDSVRDGTPLAVEVPRQSSVVADPLSRAHQAMRSVRSFVASRDARRS